MPESALILSEDETKVLNNRKMELLESHGIDERDILEEAHQSVDMWNSYFSENITRGKDDVNFTMRDQWTAVERSEFTRLFKPALTFNKMYDPVKKILAEQRKNKPDLMVRSLTGKAKQEQINLRSDIIRTMAYNSQTDLVYQTAFKSALVFGFGAFEVKIDYESPRSFHKIPRYEIIPDPIRTSFDPSAVMPHKGDGNFCSRSYIMNVKEFFATYPWVINPVSWIDPDMVLNFDWQMQDIVAFCDFTMKKWFPVKLYQLSNGQSVTQEEWPKIEEMYEKRRQLLEGSVVSNIMGEVPKIVAERQSQDYKILQFRLLQDQVLDVTPWPSKYLPIIFNDGDSYYIEGKQFTKSFVHDARDAQKCVNYFGSEIAGEVKNRRREQWLGTPDNIVGQEQMWRNPEQQLGILLARPDQKTGMMPTKMPAWELSQSLMSNFQRAGQDIREIMGFSESEEINGRDISGKARRERKLEGSMSAYIFRDNLNAAIEQGGRVVLDLLPHLLTEENRYMRVMTQDGNSKGIILNKRLDDGTIENEIDHGDYDVEISTGPSFAVQKDIALEFLQQTITANPQAFNLVADIWAKNLDVQFMPQLVDRLQTLVPPQIVAKEKGEELPPQPPSPQEMMMQQEFKLREQQLQDRQAELAIRQEKHELEKQKLILDAQKMIEEFAHNKRQQRVEVQKGDLEFVSRMAKIIADEKNTSNKQQK